MAQLILFTFDAVCLPKLSSTIVSLGNGGVRWLMTQLILVDLTVGTIAVSFTFILPRDCEM